MKKIFTLLSFFIFSVLLGSVAAAYTGVSPAITIPSVGGLVLFSSQFASQGVLVYTSVDVSAIARYAHQFQKTLITTLVNGMEIANDIAVMPGVKSSMKLPKLVVSDGFRPYSKTKEFKSGDLTYTDRELKVDVGKRELQIDPEDYRHTYMSTVLSPGAPATQKKIPFVQFIWSEVIKRVQSEINNRTAYFGFDKTDADQWLVGTAYTAGDKVTQAIGGITEYFEAQGATTGDDPDGDDGTNWINVTAEAVAIGLKTILEAEITAANVSEVATGAIASGADALTKLRQLFRSMTPAYKSNDIIIHLSHTDLEFYMDGAEDKITKYTMHEVSNIARKGLIPLIGTNGKGWLKPATWLGTSRRIIAEPMMGGQPKGANLVMGTDLLSDANQIATKDELWTLDAGIKMVLGWQIANLDALAVNDQE